MYKNKKSFDSGSAKTARRNYKMVEVILSSFLTVHLNNNFLIAL